jgi:hypothetical protein
MARWYRFVLVFVGSLVVAAVAPLAVAQNQSMSLTLTTQNNSGIGGTVMLADQGNGKTRVTIEATGAGAGPQPAHIHPGSCAQLDPAPRFALTSVVNGSSTTDVDTTLAQLMSQPSAVHMHKSVDELTVYVACADITASAAGQPATLPRSGDLGGDLPAAIAGLVGLTLVVLGIGLRRKAGPRGAA